ISDFSIGSNAGLGAAGQEFEREFGEFNFFGNSLVDFPSLYNHLASNFLRINGPLRIAGIEPEPIEWAQFLRKASQQFKDTETLVPNWDHYVPQLIEAAHKLSPQLGVEVETILKTPRPPAESGESLVDLRKRTAKLAMKNTGHRVNATKNHAGD